MHIDPIVNAIRSALLNQAALGSGDPSVEAAAAQLAIALEPTVRQAAFDLAQQAATEVGAQLSDRTVDVVLLDGEPSLRVVERPAATTGPPVTSEDLDARITLRLPPSLKRLIEDSVTIDGGSVNSWVVDALARRARRSEPKGQRVTEGFEL